MAIDFEKLQDSPHLLDILLQMEDVLDQMDIYVFDNWLKGEVVEGPIVRRYWLDMTLRYPFKSMPDPRAALRLLKHGIRVDYQKADKESDDFMKARRSDKDEDDQDDDDDKEKKKANESEEKKKHDQENENELVWLVRISMPRRLVVQIDAASHDFYDDEIDVDDVEDAKDSGLDDESGYQTDEQGAPGGGGPGEMGGPGDMGAPGGPGAPPPGGPNPGGVL